MNAVSRYLLIGLLLLLLGLPTAVEAQTPAQVTLTAKAGFDGYYRSNRWFPVTVSVRNDGPAIEGEIVVYPNESFTNNLFSYRAPISLPTQSAKEITVYAQLPSHKIRLLVKLFDNNNNEIAFIQSNTLYAVQDTTSLYGVVTPDPGEFAFLENISSPGRAKADLAFLQLNDLPQATTALSILDLLILNDVDTTQLTAVQRDSLYDWISNGGQLVVTGGANWQKTAVGLSDWLPVTPTGSQTVDDLPDLVTATGFPFRDPGPYVVTNSSLARGQVLLHEQGLPLLAVTSHGRGNIFFLALDPRFAPMLDWDGTEQIFNIIAAYITPNIAANQLSSTNPYSMQNLLNRISSAKLPPVWALVLFLLLYVLFAGPLNYWVLKRYNKLEMAWATIPVLIVAFTAVSYFGGTYFRGNRIGLNQLTIAQHHIEHDQAQVSSLIGLFSPSRSSYNLQFANDVLAHPLNTPNWRNVLDSSSYGSQNTLNNIPINVGDVEMFVAEAARPAIDITANGSYTIQGSRVEIDLTLQNNTDFDLEHAAVYFLGQLFRVSDGNLLANKSTTFHDTITSPSSGTGTDLASEFTSTFGHSYNNELNDLFIRTQFLSALSDTFLRQSDVNSLFILGWTKDNPQIEVTADDKPAKSTDHTFHIIEVPLTRQATPVGQSFDIPVRNLQWVTLPETTITEAAPYLSYLGNDTVAFEFTPQQEMQTLEVEGLKLFTQYEYDPPYLPDAYLWNWQTEEWEEVDTFNWGKTAVVDYQPYIGPNNAVRIQLSTPATFVQQYYQLGLTAVYPILTVNPTP